MTTILCRIPVRSSISARSDGLSVSANRPALTARKKATSGVLSRRITNPNITANSVHEGLVSTVILGLSPVQMRTNCSCTIRHLRSLADRLEDVRDDRLIGNASARRIWLLRPRLGQPIHRFDRAQDIDVCDALSFGIPSGLYVRPGEDCNDPVLNVA